MAVHIHSVLELNSSLRGFDIWATFGENLHIRLATSTSTKIQTSSHEVPVQHSTSLPGKTLYTADTISTTPTKETPVVTSDEIERLVQAITVALPANQHHLNSNSKAQAKDNICSKLNEYCTSGWPARNELPKDLKDYWKFRGKLTLSGTLLLYQSRIVIPTSMQQKTL